MKKILSLLLVLAMTLSLVACGGGGQSNQGGQSGNQTNNSGTGNTDNTPDDTDTPDDSGSDEGGYTGLDWEAIDAMDWDDASQAVYDAALGEFYDYYMTAKDETEDLEMRKALMAIAQAKLLESGTFLPYSTNGGNYAMSRIVPRTITQVKWGLDDGRFHTYLIANELIKAEDRTALVELWNQAATAEDYFTAARAFLDEHGYTLTDTYNFSFSEDIQTWDIFVTSSATDTDYICLTTDGLLAYDAKNVLQPALAESYEVSDDGLTYTFHIRQGVKWVDQQGREIADVQADDWVAGAQHLADNPDALGYLLQSGDGCGIKNFDAYLAGEITDFAEVGVKAVDQYTLEYTLEQPFTPFLTMMCYGCFAPLCRSFYESQGGKFGAEFDAAAADYTYGKTPANIAYCGPYLITDFTAKAQIKYAVNPTYWNKDAVSVNNINVTWNDGTDTLRAYNEAKAGTITGCGFNANALVQSQQDIDPVTGKTYFDAYSYVSIAGVYSYSGWWNLNRSAFANFNDETKAVSGKTDEQIDRYRKAINNVHFRNAVNFALDRAAYRVPSVGEDLKYVSVRNSYVPGDFQYLDTDVTVDMNGTPTTFPAGTAFGAITQAQLEADGSPIQCFDPAGNDGAGSSDGFDGWFNVDAAKAEMEIAIEELAQIGVDISAENPIVVEYPYRSDSEVTVNLANVYKQSIETNLDGLVQVMLTDAGDINGYNYATYYMSTGDQANYDIALNSGWGPDYGDAQTFLDTLQPESYMTKCLGLW